MFSNNCELPAECLGTELRRLQRLSAYPIRRLPVELARHLQDWPRSGSLANLFDCYLDITGVQVPTSWRNGAGITPFARGFVGALNSERFVQLSPMRARLLTRCFLAALEALGCTGLEDLYPRVRRPTPAIDDERLTFTLQKLDQKAVEYWRGWPIRGDSGKEMWLPLSEVFVHMGPAWTRELHTATGAWFRTVRADGIPGFREFTSFLIEHKLTPSSIRDPRGSTAMWRAFWEFYSKKRGNTTTNRKIIEDWSCHWAHFAKTVLGPAGLAAVNARAFPGPRGAVGKKHHSSEPPAGGIETPLHGLLVDVPRHFSDTAALDSIVREVPIRINQIRKWAQSECELVFRAYKRRRSLARDGEPRFIGGPKYPTGVEIWKKDRDNPEHLRHAAATFEAYGYGTSADLPLQQLYPSPIVQTAKELGIPTAGTLLSFATLLVAEHPEITPSFLENLELYDKHGRLAGYRVLDGGSYLVGVKQRKGAQQRIKLSGLAVRTIRRMLLITHTLREYLRKRGVDDWRYLCLSTKQGWGFPVRVKRFATFSSGQHCMPALISQFQEHCGLSKSEASSLVSKFSLRSLRTTVGIKVFIDTHSEQSMSQALGHEQFTTSLLGRYLPASLLAFFRARWIAAFQTQIILVVTRGTGFELKASGFASTAVMKTFLEGNAFPRLESILTDNIRSRPLVEEGTFFFNANEQTLTALVCVAAEHKRREHQYLQQDYWGHFSKHMLAHLETRRGVDPELDACLAAARESALRLDEEC